MIALCFPSLLTSDVYSIHDLSKFMLTKNRYEIIHKKEINPMKIESDVKLETTKVEPVIKTESEKSESKEPTVAWDGDGTLDRRFTRSAAVQYLR